MPGKRGIGLGAGALAVTAAGLLFSGCFQFQSLKFDPAVAKAGKKTSVLVRVIPETSSTGVKDKMVPFVLVGLNDNAGGSLAGTAKFDVKGDFGGPYEMFSDGTMRNVAIQSSDCSFGGGTPDQEPDTTWTVLRTGPKVSDKDKHKSALVKIPIRAPVTSGEGQITMSVFSGNWSEGLNPNNVPENQEVVCSGGSIASYTVTP